jgi:hypothetical protein
MPGVVPGLAYAGAFIFSGAVSALSLWWMRPLLPPDTPGLFLAVIIVVAGAWGIAVIERRMTWSHWLQPRRSEPVPILKAQSSLLAGRVPPPFAMGAIAGAVLYVKIC